MPITKMAQCQNCQQTNPPMAKAHRHLICRGHLG
jgi:hypothetical protein